MFDLRLWAYVLILLVGLGVAIFRELEAKIRLKDPVHDTGTSKQRADRHYITLDNITGSHAYIK
jgi:hypothetical protein